MNTITIGQEVRVHFSIIGKSDWVFDSEVMDIVEGAKGELKGVWVDHPECRGEDMLFVNLTNPNINKIVEIIEETTLDAVIERSHDKAMDLKDARKVLDKAFKWEDEDIQVSVKIYDCFESEQSYDVEIQWGIGDEAYTDCVVVDSFYSNIQGDEVTEKDAVKRAKAVLKTVKGWFNGDSQITVTNAVEVYHA
jgi:hypothetical protein